MAVSCQVQISTSDQTDLPQHFTNDVCAVLISVIFCSSMAEGWPGSKWRFWSDPFLIVRNAPVIKGTIFVLTSHILLTSLSRKLYLLSFSVYFVLTFELSGMALSISGQVFSLLSCSTVSGRFASIVQPVMTGRSHISGTFDIYDTFSCILALLLLLLLSRTYLLHGAAFFLRSYPVLN